MISDVDLGLRKNIGQFILLVIVNVFVGGMVGLERAILPQIAESEFQIAAATAVLSFIAVFGFSKAVTNYLTGRLSDRIGRRRLLILGWIIGIPVPVILMFAPSWNWIVGANILLGINQGLTWSSTVVMKIDLVGERSRGLAMGLNEFAGYISVAAVAFMTGWIAGNYGSRPYPFIIGVVLSIAGLIVSWWFIRDTRHHVAKEAIDSNAKRLKGVFWSTTLFDRDLGSVTLAGLVNNLNDGMMWGLLPMLLLVGQFTIEEIGIVTAIYPAVWGVGQLFTGKLSDHFIKKHLLFLGMLLQAIALFVIAFAETLSHFVILSSVLGFGTALVYPTFLAAIAENTHPHDRAESLGVFRLWRDMGYVFGAIITGVLADTFGMSASIIVIAAMTLISAIIIEARMTPSIKPVAS